MALRDADRAAIRAAVAAGLDWQRLLWLAEWHGLRPLLHRHLDACVRDGVPRDASIRLWAQAAEIARRNARAASELVEILRALQARGVRALPYKGPALAVTAYGDVGLREFGDLDILVRREDVDAAQHVLEERGYAPRYPLAAASRRAFLASDAQYHLVLEQPGHPMVELHWKTDPDFPVERMADDAWWSHLDRVDLAGAALPAFRAEDLLLVLCIHGARHRWSSLGWLVDVAEAIRRHPATDFGRLLERAAALGCRRRVLLGLRLAERLLATDLPAPVRRALEERGVAILAAEVEAGLFAPDGRPGGALRELGFALRSYERSRHRARHCVQVLFRPSLVEWTRWPLPRRLGFLYPPLRVARLAAKYLGRKPKEP